MPSKKAISQIKFYFMANVLFLLQRYPGLGGIEIVTTVIANYLVNQNYNIFFYSITTGKEYTKLDNRIVIYHNTKNKKEEQSAEFLKFCIDNKIDCIILHDNYDIKPEFFMNAIKHLQCKFFVVEHSDPMGVIEGVKRVMKRKQHGNIHDLLWLLKNYNYDKKITQSYIARKNQLFTICNKYIILSKRFTNGIKYCIPNYDKNKLIAINNPLTVPIVKCKKQKNIVVFIGRLEKAKRIDYLIQVLTRIAPRYLNWDFHIYGDGSERGTIEKFIKSQVSPNIKYYGPTNNTPYVLQEAKILLMTSEYEGWGLVLTEAMANGTVPIAFDSYASIHDIIENEVDGILVSPFNINEYCSKLSRLLDNDTIYQMYHNKVYSKAALFQIDNFIGKQWKELLEILINKSI